MCGLVTGQQGSLVSYLSYKEKGRSCGQQLLRMLRWDFLNHLCFSASGDQVKSKSDRENPFFQKFSK